MKKENSHITIIAKTWPGAEFYYNTKSAHAVSRSSADRICRACNEYKYKLGDGEIWHVYTIDQYEKAYAIAQVQRGRIYKGTIKMYSPIM